MRKILLVIIGVLAASQLILGQTADVLKGCSPLEVNFEGPDQAAWYWDFVEGNASSTLQNPVHIFTNPGTYLVVLYDGEGGTKIGDLEIKVYEDPVITIKADTLLGCSPLTVQFTSTVELDPELTLEEYLWAFGDGSTSSDPNPIHVYTVGGTFDVSLEISTNLTECNEIFTLKDYISTNLLDVQFDAHEYDFCYAPVKVKFVNNTLFSPENTYEWDFGNGQNYSGFQPDSIAYTEFGNYTVRLTVTSPEGCDVTISRTISVGKPIFDLSLPEVACLKEYLFFDNLTIANEFEWTFGSGASTQNSTDRNPEIRYFTPGLKSISLKAFKDADCVSDTTFYITIEDPDASFTVDPFITCEDPVLVNVKALNEDYTKYSWEVSHPDISLADGLSASFTYKDKVRDSLYWHQSDTIYILLEVTSQYGCIGEKREMFIQSKPNAHFIPNIAQGCAPLEVVFDEHSHSLENITRYSFDFGDGSSQTFNSSTDPDHIYSDPGEYYVKLIIENEAGCIDTSAGVWIEVGEPIAPQFELDKTEICLGESVSVTFNNTDPRIDAYHLDSDDGRFIQCWTEKQATHTFNTLPGEYSVLAETEYNGCYAQDASHPKILVKGAKADIAFMTSCESPYEVMFTDESTNASKLQWTIGTTLIEDSTDFSFVFDSTGDYTVILEAIDEASGCPANLASESIYIREIKAHFEIEDKVCDNLLYTIDGSKSEDVDNDCSKGYLWYIPTRRPWESPYDTITTAFPSGKNSIALVVEDINGCRDTMIREIDSYGIDPYFTVDKNEFCLPASLQVENGSLSDTTIVSWIWQNGDNAVNPVFNLDESYPDNKYIIEMIAEDALGCRDTFSRKLPIYKPYSELYLFPGQNFCVGDELTFFADDFTEKDSYLNFYWDLGAAGEYTGMTQTITLNERGNYPVKLTFVEESSGCTDSLFSTFNVVDLPEADFLTDVDNIDPLCYPKIINFFNNSVFDSLGYVTWMVEGVTFANDHASIQTIELPKGQHEVHLVATSVFGCADTLTRTFDLVGPEGEVFTDKSTICLGDSIEFTLSNLVDVNDFEWDFGDGTTVSNINPVKHVFEDDVELFDAKVILKSQENGCSHILEIPLSIFDVTADFNVLDDLALCPGQVYIENLSTGADQYDWSYDPGELQSEGDTLLVVFPEEGEYTINLLASNSNNECTDEISKTVTVTDLDDFIIIPNMFTPNGDGENDIFRPVISAQNSNFEVEFTTFQVYNRWGNLVYDNGDPSLGWDGRYDMTDAPTGVYAYFLEADINGCQTVISRGNVTLAR